MLSGAQRLRPRNDSVRRSSVDVALHLYESTNAVLADDDLGVMSRPSIEVSHSVDARQPTDNIERPWFERGVYLHCLWHIHSACEYSISSEH